MDLSDRVIMYVYPRKTEVEYPALKIAYHDLIVFPAVANGHHATNKDFRLDIGKEIQNKACAENIRYKPPNSLSADSNSQSCSAMPSSR